MCQNLAGGIKALSDQHSCNTMSGTIEGVRYTYHSTGQHCDTTAQRDTIAGAIKKFLLNVEHNKICGIDLCLYTGKSPIFPLWNNDCYAALLDVLEDLPGEGRKESILCYQPHQS
jgi:hypothetical protein